MADLVRCGPVVSVGQPEPGEEPLAVQVARRCTAVGIGPEDLELATWARWNTLALERAARTA